VAAGNSAGVILDHEVDLSRGDSLTEVEGPHLGRDTVELTVAWMDDEPLVAGRSYWALHGHRWVKAKVERIAYRLNIHTLKREDANSLRANEIGHITMRLQEPLLTLPFAQSRTLGSLILVDISSHATSAAALVQ
jgi:sulfate adenylyltransferase subunit 1